MPIKIKSRITLWIFSEEFRISDYNEIDRCPVYLALKREKFDVETVGGTYAIIAGERYKISHVDEIRKRAGLPKQEHLNISLTKIKTKI